MDNEKSNHVDASHRAIREQRLAFLAQKNGLANGKVAVDWPVK